jgi:hypothetical protein
MNRSLSLPAILLALVAPCIADTVVLTSGLTIDGVVRDLGNQIEVKVPEGTFYYRKDTVKQIRKGQSLLEWYAQRKAQVRVGDVAAHLKLAGECDAKRMKLQAEEQYRNVLGQEPDNDVARKALGYERIEGKWMLESEAMPAKGFVKVDGKWLAREDAARLSKHRQAEAQVRAAEYQRQLQDYRSATEQRERAAKEEAEAAVQRREKQLKEAQEAALRREREQRFSYCPKCSAKVPDGDKNCPNCQRRIY